MLPIPPEILRQVKRIALRTRGLVDTLLAGEYRSVFRGHGMEFAEVRAYEIGDDYRSIDWNVSARLGAPYVKTFTEEREVTLFLLVDRSGSTTVGDPVAKAEREVEVAAVLALAAAEGHDRVGALIFTDQVEHVVPPGKGRRHALRVIRDLLAFEPTGRGTDLVTPLHQAALVLKHRSVVVVLSDFLAPGWERPLRQLAVRHQVFAITVDDPRDLAPPASGWLLLEDAESGRRAMVDTGDLARRRQWSAIATRHHLARADRLRSAGAYQVALGTTGDYAPELRRAFARRIHRRGR
ncbi:MAG TPA: DUF58 domain-containing protein [Gemmatimonadales bacterium]